MTSAAVPKFGSVGALGSLGALGWILLASTVVLLPAVAAAGAEDEGPSFAERHQVVLSAERLFGFTHTSSPGAAGVGSVNSFSLLSDPYASVFGAVASAPRVGVDAFVAGRLSVGGSLAYFAFSPSSTTPAVEVASESGLLVAPRVGYGARLGRRLSLWPRLGLTYLHAATSGAGLTGTLSTFILTIDAPLVVVIAPRFYAAVAPTIDEGLGGSRSGGATVEGNLKGRDYGLLCALGGYF